MRLREALTRIAEFQPDVELKSHVWHTLSIEIYVGADDAVFVNDAELTTPLDIGPTVQQVRPDDS